MTSTEATNGFSFDFQEFAGDTEATSKIPHCQIISPPKLDPKELREYIASKTKPIFGWFIPQAQADIAGFTPDESWIETTRNFTEDEDDLTPGWLSLNPRFCVIHQSQLEVQTKAEKGYQFLGLAYNGGIETEYMDIVKADRTNNKLCTRLLLLFLGKDNQPLHTQSPFALSARAGFGGALGTELKEYYKSLNDVYFKAAARAGTKTSGGRLNMLARAHGVLDIEFWYHFGDPKQSSYVVPCKRLAPALDQSGKEKIVTRGGGFNVKLIGESLATLMVGKRSRAGELIGQWFSEYEDFPKPNRGYGEKDESEGANEPSASGFQGIGKFNQTSINYSEDENGLPWAEVVFVCNQKSYLCLLSPEFVQVLDVEGFVQVNGTLQDGVVTVSSASALEASPVSSAGGEVEDLPAPEPAKRQSPAAKSKSKSKAGIPPAPVAAQTDEYSDIPF